MRKWLRLQGWTFRFEKSIGAVRRRSSVENQKCHRSISFRDEEDEAGGEARPRLDGGCCGSISATINSFYFLSRDFACSTTPLALTLAKQLLSNKTIFFSCSGRESNSRAPSVSQSVNPTDRKSDSPQKTLLVTMFFSLSVTELSLLFLFFFLHFFSLLF